MKKAMLSFSRPKKLFLLLSLFVVGSLFIQSSALFTQSAKAVTITPEQCYAFNGTTYNSNIRWMHTDEQDECVKQKYCDSNNLSPLTCNEDLYKRLTGKITVSASQCYTYNGSNYSSTIAGGSTPEQLACITQGYCKEDTSANYRKPLPCSEEIYKASEPYKAIQQAALVKAKQDALVGPVAVLICGEAPAGEAAQSVYMKCYDEVVQAYSKCSVNTTGPIGSENTAATSQQLAACLKEQTGTKVTVAALTEAVEQGKEASDKLVLPDPTKTCGSGEVLKDGKCITVSTVCTGGTLGWIMCPLVDVFSSVISVTADFLNSMLFINPIGGNTNIQPIWATFVGIANLLLVIGFLVVIFSQATSIGLNAYGIKKMLPRIIAAAILINLSYFICTLALDITNIIGGTVGNIVHSFIPTSSDIKLSGGTVLDKSASWASWLGVTIGTLGVVAAAAAVGAIAFLVPLLLSAAFSVVAIFLIIALRQVLVILLVIISPLAFAAMILPNTEQLFGKWRKLFTSMLAMYPVAMFILYGSQLVGALLLMSKNIGAESSENVANSWVIDIVATIIMTVGPFAGLFMYLKNSNKLMSMAANGVGKVGKWGQGKANGWAKEKQGNSRYAQARAWNKSLRDANRIERQGKMTGVQGRLNKAASYAAGATLNPKKWRDNAGKYQASVVNRAAINDDKIFKEDKENAHAAYSQNGIAGPLMVAHARSGRVVRENADGTKTYGRKLTEAEHAAAVEWTMSNGKLAERQEVYGSDWAAKGRNSQNRRALDAMNDGYFHTNKDVVRFGNKFGGTMTSGTVGGEMGVDNAAIVNMASGKTAAEAIIDNDMAQGLADLNALTPAELSKRITDFNLLPPEMAAAGVTADQYAVKFRENTKKLADTIAGNRELQSRVKPEFQGALNELRTGTPAADRRAKTTVAGKDKNTQLYEKRARLQNPSDGQQIDLDIKERELTAIVPALDKTV